MKPLQQVFALVLEELIDFRAKRGRQDKNNPHGLEQSGVVLAHTPPATEEQEESEAA